MKKFLTPEILDMVKRHLVPFLQSAAPAFSLSFCLILVPIALGSVLQRVDNFIQWIKSLSSGYNLLRCPVKLEKAPILLVFNGFYPLK